MLCKKKQADCGFAASEGLQLLLTFTCTTEQSVNSNYFGIVFPSSAENILIWSLDNKGLTLLL